MSTIVNTIREASVNLKTNKHNIAANVIDGTKEAVVQAATTLQFYCGVFKAYADISSGAAKVITTAIKNDKAVAAFKGIVAHVVHDVGSRLNEIGNLVEMLEQDPEISAATEEITAASQRLVGVMDEYMKATMAKQEIDEESAPPAKRPRKRKMAVVQ